ncbi:glycosyltransferase family 4 protein [Actinopolymorpha alba]|uniref:glycosyltransferase family 4 protein n=1 Tax=Actinopolymorpha alba TaxID=533267 RepID=UPI000361D037|nr:glycosyltransferase family 4 protein [Actinopolymorpha alba]
MSLADQLSQKAAEVSKGLGAIARQRLSPQTKKRIRKVQRAVLGRRTATVTRSGLTAARACLGAQEYDEAASHVNAVLRRNPNDQAALELASKIAIKRGEFTEAGIHAVRRAERTRDPVHWSYARKIVGRTRETDPRWQPRILTPPPPSLADQAGTGKALYLAKESRPFLHNGFCTRSHESLQALVRAGRDVLGVTMPGFPGVLGVEDPPNVSVVEEVTYHHLLPNAGRRLLALPLDEYVELTARTLAGLVARERPGLLHVSSGHRGFESALAGNAVARWAGIPWLYEVRSFFETTWTDDPRYAERGEYYQRRFATESRMMRAADLVITLSGPMRDEIIDQHGIPADKVRVVPNAVDLSRFTPRERDPELRRKLGLTDTFTLGYVSNLSHPREGQEVLIEAVAKLRAQGRAVTGLLVGDGNRRAELERLASRLGVARHVVFTGNVPFDEVAGHYAQIDLFVVPRVDDRAARMVSPMKPFEAMAMRVPLLVADLPALAEIVGSDLRGHLFRTGDPAALAAAAARLMDDATERQRLVESAAAWVAAERSWDAVAGAFSAAYDELLDAAGRPTASASELADQTPQEVPAC